MTPAPFPEANVVFGPPEGMAESQVLPIHAYRGTVGAGSVDGAQVIVTAWQPSPQEMELIAAGQPIFLTFLCEFLPPHVPTLSFQQAINLA